LGTRPGLTRLNYSNKKWLINQSPLFLKKVGITLNLTRDFIKNKIIYFTQLLQWWRNEYPKPRPNGAASSKCRRGSNSGRSSGPEP